MDDCRGSQLAVVPEGVAVPIARAGRGVLAGILLGAAIGSGIASVIIGVVVAVDGTNQTSALQAGAS